MALFALFLDFRHERVRLRELVGFWLLSPYATRAAQLSGSKILLAS